MTPETQQELAQHVKAIAALLYEETEPEQLKSLEKIEGTIREQTLEYITPQIGVFLSKKQREQRQDDQES